jgi:type I restriction enzyme, S subunit
MEVSAGYKQTEVGVVPEDWDLKELGEIASIAAGGTPSRENPAYWNGDIPWITTTQIDFNLITKADQFITPQGLKNSAAKLLTPGTLLLALYGQGKTRGKVGILGIEAASNQACASISITSSVSRNFVFNYLVSQYDVIRGMSNSGSQENLNGHIVKSILIPFPPTKAEQEAIAEALSDADALIESLTQLIAKKRQIKQGAMQELLTGKRRLPGFGKAASGYKQTEVGVIPEDWVVAKLRNHVTFKTGPFGSSLHKSDYVDGGIPVINPMQIIEGKIVPTRSMAITEQAARHLAEFRLLYGNIVIGRRGEMGRCAYVDAEQEGWLCGTGSMIIRPSNTVDGRFLQRVLSSPPMVAAIENSSVGTTMINLNQNTLGNLELALPPTKAEQEAIAEVLSGMDAEITALEAKLAKARQVKQGMMHNLLTGRIRLV